MNTLFRVCAATAMFALAACSASNNADNTQPAAEVSTTTPVQKTFHAKVAAIGQLAADSRNALSLSLPQAGQVATTGVIAGQRVKRGDVLLKLETDPATRSAYLQARSGLKTAQADLARTLRLHAEKLATNTQLDAARKNLADARATLDAQARLGGAQAIAALRAPADGVVTALDVQRGQRIPGGTTLLQFTPSSALVARLGVDPGAAPDVRVGMPVLIDSVFASRAAPALHGTVAMVGDAINPQTHLVDVVATLDGHTPLAAGTALSAEIRTSSFKAWSLPRTALQSDAQGDYVYQIEHGKARRVDVKVLAPDGSPIGVEGDLDTHAPVITLGSHEISDGDPVRGASAASHGAASR
jgi:RND family efflux transporter MFP subunit